MKRFIQVFKKGRMPLIIITLLAAAGVIWFFMWGKPADASDYITGKIDRGTVEVTVAATGTVQAVTTVQVGSQVSGTLAWLGADFNTQVKRGQVIARLDPAIHRDADLGARRWIAGSSPAMTKRRSKRRGR